MSGDGVSGSRAAQSARDMIAEELRGGKPVPARWEARVEDADGKVLDVIPLAVLVGTEHGYKAPTRTEESTRNPASFAADAGARATADRSRSLNNDMQRTVSNIRAQLRTMAAWKIG